MRSPTLLSERWHELPVMARRAAHALEYLHIHPTTPTDLQNPSWLTMMCRRACVSQESPESQGHRAHAHVATRVYLSNQKVPPATLNTGTPRQLALQSLVPSLVLAINSIKCPVS